MTEARVKAGLWVAMALRLGDQAGRPGAVLRRGDADAGGILVVLREPGGFGAAAMCVLSQVRSGSGEVAWLRATGAAAVDQTTADAYVARQVRIDPDLWVIEFDAPDLLPPFEAKLL